MDIIIAIIALGVGYHMWIAFLQFLLRWKHGPDINLEDDDDD